MIRKEAWTFYRTISGIRLCWVLEEPKGPKGLLVPVRVLEPAAHPGRVEQVPEGAVGLDDAGREPLGP